MIQRILIPLFALLPVFLQAQGDPLVEAYRKYRAGEVQEARTFIDRAVASEAHANDPEAWLLHGFIYKDLYKEHAPGDQADALRSQAVNSLYKCIELDRDGANAANAKQAYEYLARSYFNDAARELNAMDADAAVRSFAHYKETLERLDPKSDVRQKEIEFHNALGTVYTRSFNIDRNRLDQFEKAVAAYERVMKLDPANYGANYNLATLYYNRGVFKIRTIDAEHDIPSIQQIQEASREFFQLALPYMLKAHEMDPGRRETLLGLEGIYYSLQDQENSDKFRLLYEELPPQEQDR